MSGPAIHHLVAKNFANKLKATLPPDQSAMAEKLTAGHAPYFFLGSQGPDFLFFNTKDMDPTIRKFVEMYYDVVDFIEEFKKMLIGIIPEELIQAVETLETVWDNLVERSSAIEEITEIAADVSNTISLLKANLEAKVKEYITDNVEVFDLLKHPIQDGQPHKDWWWFDTLHYRRTGQYADALLKNSPVGTPEHAYALGYLSHFACDTVGHPFVNIISGGPYRTHPKRHKLVENMQDVWAYKNFANNGEFIQSKLSEEYKFNGDATKLPPKLNKLILDSIRDVFNKNGSTQYGKSMTSSDLDDAYRMWMTWFEKTTNALDLPLPQPYSFTAEIQEVWDTFTDNTSDIFDWVGNSGGNGGILGFLSFLAALILAPILLAAAAIDAIAGAIATVGAAGARFLISLAYEFLYNSFMNFHQGVVLNGLAFPFKNQLDHYLVKHVLNSSSPDVIGNNANTFAPHYPFGKFSLPGLESEGHLIYPYLNIEKDACTGAPKSYFDANASHYMFGKIELSDKAYKKYIDFQEKNGNMNEADVNARFGQLQAQAARDSLGNAVDLGKFLYNKFLEGKKIGDFNLDADKGIAFQSWRKVKKFSDLNDPNAPHVAVTTDNTVLNTRTDIINPNNDIL
ncbi:MAG: zinc dependent phospholipase C family protein [Bacteroidota bacterium]